MNLVHHMGGTIRKDFSTKVTHLVAHSTHGEKYRVRELFVVPGNVVGSAVASICAPFIVNCL